MNYMHSTFKFDIGVTANSTTTTNHWQVWLYLTFTEPRKTIDNALMCLQPICLYVFLSEESLYEAAYFHAISQRSKLAVDLIQFCKPNENEDPTAPVLRAMEEIRKLKAQVILLYTDKESVELMLQQVSMCAILVQREITLFVLKELNLMPDTSLWNSNVHRE